MQTQHSKPQSKRRTPTVIMIIFSVIIGIAFLWFIFGKLMPLLGYKDPETQEAKLEKPLPKVKKFNVNLHIQSNVAGAEVYVNDELTTVTRNLDLQASVFNLKPGKYEIRLKKRGYQDAVKQIEIIGYKATEKINIKLEKVVLR